MGAKRKYQYVYAHLSEQMDKRRITAEDLARACSLSDSAVYSKLIGAQRFTPRQRQAIGRAFFPGLDAHWLFEEDQEARKYNRELKAAEQAQKELEGEADSEEAESLAAFLEGLSAVPGPVGKEARERARQIVRGMLLDADK